MLVSTTMLVVDACNENSSLKSVEGLGYNERSPILHSMAESGVMRYMDDSSSSSDGGDAPTPGQDVRWDASLDEPDFGFPTGSRNSFKEVSGRWLPALSLPLSSGEDVLGMLAHTPDDPYTASPLGEHSKRDSARQWSVVYSELPFTAVMPGVFLRDRAVHLRQVVLEPVPATLHIFNQYRVEMQLQHGDFRWDVRTRLKNITSLHRELILFKMKLLVPAATQSGRDRRQTLRAQLHHSTALQPPDTAADRHHTGNGLRQEEDAVDGNEAVRRDSIDSRRSYTHPRAVKFPRKSLARMDENTATKLEQYLRNLLLHSLFRGHRDVLALFEISALSFVRGLGQKLKEGFVRKRAGGYTATAGCCSNCCCGACSMWSGQYQERWLVLKETCLFFVSPQTGAVRGVLLMDADFKVSSGFRHTGINNGLIVTSLSRRLVMMCDSDQSEKHWSSEIIRVQHQHASDFVSSSNRHRSFAPEREGAMANWYVDGNRYMWDVADAIDGAQEEVFITDWWLSPDIYMKRPDLTATQWKLSEVLKRAAERGVRVRVLLYKEVEMALGLNSIYTKHCLASMHPNIKVLRHPDHGGGGTLYWAHHEKLVIVDQQYAFVSGIDLCYGRWDDYRHKLVDLGHAGRQKPPPVTAAATLSPSNNKKLKKDLHGDSPASIAKLVIGSTMLINTLQSPAGTPAVSPCSSPLLRRSPAALSRSSAPPQVDADVSQRAKAKPSLSLQLPLNAPCSPDANIKLQPITGSPSRNQSLSESNDNIDTDNTLTTDVDVTIDVSNASSLHNIPDIVEEVLKRRRSQKICEPDPKWNKDDEYIETSDEDILVESSISRNGLDTVDGNRVRSESDPTKKGRKRYILWKRSTSESRQRGLSVHHRRKSLELLERHSYSKQSSGGAKSDGDIYSEGEDEVACVGRRHQSVGSVGDGRQGAMTRNLNAVRSKGKELVGGMKSKSSGVKNWTRRRMPGLNRTGSVNSECDLVDEANKNTRKSAGRWRARAARLGKTKQASAKPSVYQDQGPTLHDSTSIHLWVGKDYVNWIAKDLDNPDEPFSDSVDRHRTPRMPWHDIGLYVEGPAARDAARHFIQRWNAVKNEKVKANEKYPFLLPRSYQSASFRPSPMLHKQKVKCQVVRSVGEWSGGQHETERSIYNAYHSAIKDAQHYIYVENQFFISSADITSRTDVHNRIAAEIVDRIVKAHRSNSVFRVFVLLPLLPAFEGQIGTPSGTAIQFIMHYTLSTIARGEHSLIQSLQRRGVSDWRQYLCFTSLRSHDTLDGSLVTELIYIHSKLLIVDDRLVIAGSANINDRSMLGDRDSEVALLVEDEEFEEGVMNGAPFKRGLFAGSLRRYLFSEHLGLIEPAPTQVDEMFHTAAPADAAGEAERSAAASKRLVIEDIADPASEKFFKDVWQGTAASNTKIYDEVFQCYPSNGAQTFEEVERLRSTPTLATMNPDLATLRLQDVQGNVVEFPLEFLQQEVLKPGLGNKESLLPSEMWT